MVLVSLIMGINTVHQVTPAPDELVAAESSPESHEGEEKSGEDEVKKWTDLNGGVFFKDNIALHYSLLTETSYHWHEVYFEVPCSPPRYS